MFQSARAWKQRVLSGRFGPLTMQFRAEPGRLRPTGWPHRNLFLEGLAVRTGDQTIRDALLAEGP